MERRKALAVAGTVAGTLAAAGAAMVVNFGLLGAQASEVGNLDVKGAAALVPAPTTTTLSVVRAASAWPPHMSTTSSPSMTIAMAAPTSSP